MNEKKKAYNKDYDAEHMKAYTVKYPIEIYQAVESAMNDSGLNRNRWTTQAIVEKLQREGYLNNQDSE